MVFTFDLGLALRRSAIVLGAVMMTIPACGKATANVASADQTASGARTSPTTVVSPAPDSAPLSTANWTTYSSTKWGYTLKYPQGWYLIPNNGAPATESYFSNELVGPPSDMDADGIYVAISTNPKTSQSCPSTSAPPASVTKQDNVSVDGVPATLNYVGAQLYWELYVEHFGLCYRFAFINHAGATSSTTSATENTAVAMVGTFAFGTPPTSAP